MLLGLSWLWLCVCALQEPQLAGPVAQVAMKVMVRAKEVGVSNAVHSIIQDA